ncbi:restriction endonuclease subunit S [Streptomyces sp. PU10]|uniref:restriction endonuclease subunit S n=1 Tax=Streptomyces sp. PU10 TaxID=3062780 RepID=UPI0028FC5F99|nr:restriction endonuclease subunit S [Streptomyces sp. PU10]MDU0257452.1 restriction endonuclease subunit S [Streptomyces sp. PU10]
MTITDKWLNTAPTHWTRGRLKNLISSVTNGTWGSDPVENGYDVRCVRAADFDRASRRVDLSTAPLRHVEPSSFRQHLLKAGDLILEKSGGGEKQPVGMAVLFTGSTKAVCSNFCARVRPAAGVDHRFLTYVFAAAYGQGLTQAAVKQTTGIQNLDTGAFFASRWTYPAKDEQRRIADFLDIEIGRIDRVRKSREAQGELLNLMLDQLVDGATAGDSETLKRLGVDSNRADWGLGRISRLCQVVPGYAFPSEEFLHNGGTRLLRGINVSVDETSWKDTVSWDEEKMPTPPRFHLRDGDLIVGMDRPWISSGMRMTFISERDLPALLLQRVACLRPKSTEVDMKYVYWSLRSSMFRQAVEGELTGVSVPHLSGDQIGGFTFPLPPVSTQRDISHRLSNHSASIRKLRSTMQRQVKLLDERRQTLITAAVTGQFDISTASGRSVTEGVSA